MEYKNQTIWNTPLKAFEMYVDSSEKLNLFNTLADEFRTDCKTLLNTLSESDKTHYTYRTVMMKMWYSGKI
jgi:hypothetical protein